MTKHTVAVRRAPPIRQPVHLLAAAWLATVSVCCGIRPSACAISLPCCHLTAFALHWVALIDNVSVDGSGFATCNPLFMKYTPTAGKFSGQQGYGYR